MECFVLPTVASHDSLLTHSPRCLAGGWVTLITLLQASANNLAQFCRSPMGVGGGWARRLLPPAPHAIQQY